MTIRANNTHIIFNDGTTQNTGEIITRVINCGNGHSMIASISNGLITLKTIVGLGGATDANTTHFVLKGFETGGPEPVGSE